MENSAVRRFAGQAKDGFGLDRALTGMMVARKRARIAAVPGLFAILMQALLAVMPMPAMAAGAMAHARTLCVSGDPGGNSKPVKPAPGVIAGCALCPICHLHTPILPREPIADTPGHATAVAHDVAPLGLARARLALGNQPRAPPSA